MRVGIVGHESKKFTAITEPLAREVIRYLLSPPDAVLVSGRSPLGGIDVWAEEEAEDLGRQTLIFPATVQTWSGLTVNGKYLQGFKDRNGLIAVNSAIVHVIVVQDYPDGFAGMRRLKNGAPWCYHCKGRIGPHVKSGRVLDGLAMSEPSVVDPLMPKKPLSRLEASMKAPEIVASVIMEVKVLQRFVQAYPEQAARARALFPDHEWILLAIMNHPKFQEPV